MYDTKTGTGVSQKSFQLSFPNAESFHLGTTLVRVLVARLVRSLGVEMRLVGLLVGSSVNSRLVAIHRDVRVATPLFCVTGNAVGSRVAAFCIVKFDIAVSRFI